MSEMVERVARILCQQAYYDPDELEPGDEFWVDGYNGKDEPCHFMWREFVDKASMVIEAMREPTKAMLNRGGYHCITGAGSVRAGNIAQAKAVWKAMVREALPIEP